MRWEKFSPPRWDSELLRLLAGPAWMVNPSYLAALIRLALFRWHWKRNCCIGKLMYRAA